MAIQWADFSTWVFDVPLLMYEVTVKIANAELLLDPTQKARFGQFLWPSYQKVLSAKGINSVGLASQFYRGLLAQVQLKYDPLAVLPTSDLIDLAQGIQRVQPVPVTELEDQQRKAEWWTKAEDARNGTQAPSVRRAQ